MLIDAFNKSTFIAVLDPAYIFTSNQSGKGREQTVASFSYRLCIEPTLQCSARRGDGAGCDGASSADQATFIFALASTCRTHLQRGTSLSQIPSLWELQNKFYLAMFNFSFVRQRQTGLFYRLFSNSNKYMPANQFVYKSRWQRTSHMQQIITA